LLDELGSPVCDLRQWADFGVRVSVGKDEVCRHQEKTADPRYTSIIEGQDLFVKWQLPDQLFDPFSMSFQLWVALLGWTGPTAKQQLPKAIHYP
jgi:hypothetical protein